MESLVKFRNRQELQSSDLNNVQTFARSALDHVVYDGVEPTRAYAGLACTKGAATVVSIAVGRLYIAGAVYASNSVVNIDLFNYLPITTYKRVAIVAWPQEVDTDNQSRDFLIDAESGAVEPDAVYMRADRVCTLSAVAGDEAPSPEYPEISANVLPIAYVFLDTNGIVSVDMVTANSLNSVRSVANRTSALEVWRSQVSAAVDNLRSDLFALAARVTALFTEVGAALAAITRRLEALEAKVNQPVSGTLYVQYSNNHFLNTDDSNDQRAGYDCRIFEGIRLPYAASDVGQLALLNPQDVNAKVVDGLLMPTYSSVKRIDTGTHDAELRLSVYSYQTTTAEKRQLSRTRIRYGKAFTVCSNSTFWNGGTYDPITHIFIKDGETYVLEGTPPYNGGAVTDWWWWWRWNWHGYIRVKQFWKDTVTEDYWSLNTVEHNVNGQIIAQTHLCSQDGWLVGLSPKFTRVAGSGDVTLMICETSNGEPDLNKVIMHTTVAVADLKTNKSEITIPATFLRAGKRYALIMSTAGDHYVGTTTSANAVLQGTLFYCTDGGYFQGVLDKDLCCDWHFAKWAKSRYAIDCAPFVLAGGIHDIDVLADMVEPGASDLHFEVQINGIWRSLGPDNQVSLNNLPALLPMRIVFNGTADVMPCIGIEERSQVILSRPKTSGKWMSANRDLGTNIATIKLQFRLEGFDDNVHDYTCKLFCGGTYATEEAADSTSDITMPDGSILRTFTFNITTAQKYYIEASMSVSSIDTVFHVGEMIEYAAA